MNVFIALKGTNVLFLLTLCQNLVLQRTSTVQSTDLVFLDNCIPPHWEMFVATARKSIKFLIKEGNWNLQICMRTHVAISNSLQVCLC